VKSAGRINTDCADFTDGIETQRNREGRESREENKRKRIQLLKD
jgi:hypothetical protein